MFGRVPTCTNTFRIFSVRPATLYRVYMPFDVPWPHPYMYPRVCAATPSRGVEVLDSGMCSFIFCPHLSVGPIRYQLHTAYGSPFPNRHAQLAKYVERWQGLMAAYDSAGTGQVGKRIVSSLCSNTSPCMLVAGQVYNNAQILNFHEDIVVG